MNEYTVSTAAEEADVSPQVSDHIFEQSLSKNTNSDDSNFFLSHTINANKVQKNFSTQPKKKIQHKRMLNSHDPSSIIEGKRTRRPIDRVSDKEKKKRLLWRQKLKEEVNEEGRMAVNNGSRLQIKIKAKNNRKLNKIFGDKTSSLEETSDETVDIKDMFENYYQRIKRNIDLFCHQTGNKIVPEKIKTTEFAVYMQGDIEEDLRRGLLSQERNSRSFLSNKNLFQKTREFEKTNIFNTMVENSSKAKPNLMNSQFHLEKLDALRKKLEEIPETIIKRTERQGLRVEEQFERQIEVDNLNQEHRHSQSYINCDLRYFNFDFLVDELGYFDVILVDPPWQNKREQENGSTLVPSNSRLNLEYDTMSNQEISNLRIDKISKKGFIFFWTLSDQLNVAYEMLNKWGYEVVDQIVWIKLKDSQVYLSQGHNFMHSFEMCLLGYKCVPGEHLEYNSKVSNNIIFSEVRKESQKPEELYEIIDLMMPGSKKVELFANSHNIRPGWFSLGNQLGEEDEKYLNSIGCNNCSQPISIGIKRYKAKGQADCNLCENCFMDLGLDRNKFFEINNMVYEDLRHNYHSCSHCLAETVHGIRYTCLDCENFDLCEACYDFNLQNNQKIHDLHHNLQTIEVPFLSNGLPAHYNKTCSCCFKEPIVGTCFSCTECSNLNFCQNCFFSKSNEEIKHFESHKPFHNIDIIPEPQLETAKSYKCSWCEVNPIEETPFKCESCFNFYFCEKCYFKRDSFESNNAHSHKFYHNFMPLQSR